MTRDEIIRMAREAGFELADNATDEALNRFRALAALVAAADRAARTPADSVLEDAARLLRQILAASQDGDSDTHLSAHFVSRVETITKAGGAA